MKRNLLGAFVLTVATGAVLVLVALPREGLVEHPWTVLLLASLAALVGGRPVRIPKLKTEVIATHPFVFCSLAAFGPLAAVLTSLMGVLGATAGRQERPKMIRLVFNVGAVVLSTALAHLAFLFLGGTPGAGAVDLILPLTGATLAYFLGNTGLVAVDIALEKNRGLLATWLGSFRWTTVSFFTGLTLAVGLLIVLEVLGPWGLALGVPPCWLLLAFYHSYKERLEEQQGRFEEVEALNAVLEQKILELRDALAQVKQLQGLLPICMHCKKIRDDRNNWHQLEAYIAAHSASTFTHSLCHACRAEHYPEVRHGGRPGSISE